MQARERPYRSHLQPACLPCRRRKSRCQSDASATVCLMCRAHGTHCQYPAGSPAISSQNQVASPPTKGGRGGRKRKRRDSMEASMPEPDPIASGTSSQFRSPADTAQSPLMGRTRLPSLATPAYAPERPAEPGRDSATMREEEDLFDSNADDQTQNLHIVGPAVSKDNQVLSDYLAAIPGAAQGSRMLLPVPAGRSRPVLFTKVQKRPFGQSIHRSPSAEILEIMENILGPQVADLVDVYFGKLNPCFPLLDEALFRRQYENNKDRVSPALIACLYAHALAHWNFTKSLSQHRCPDSRFLWNMACKAVYSELHLSPGMSIIKAILLNIGGLPTTSLIGNGVLMGSAISMAHSLGLNHNPLTWDISHSEKCLRMKIWWALLVYDRWISLAHGTPPHISGSQYDVPAPSLEYLCENPAIPSQSQPASIFIALVSLTEALYQHLQHIYNVEVDSEGSKSNLELALNNWVESLTGDVRLIILRGSHLDLPGASNLRFSYLTTRLLLQRIELEEDKQLYDPQDRRVLNRYIQARRTAEEILFLTQELKPEHLGDFWLSAHSFSYPSTVDFLLRCSLETASSPTDLVQSAPFRIAHDLIATLRSHQEKHSWPLANICLAQHSEIIDKIIASASSDQPGGISDILNVDEDFLIPDASVIDQLFPSLWDPLQTGW